METLIDANTEFGMDLLKTLMKDNPDGNIFYSTLSIAAALSMVLLGARHNTAQQMEKVLHFTEITGSKCSKDSPVSGTKCDKPGGPHEQFKTLLSAINQHSKDYALSMANRLYGSNTYNFLQQYLDCTKELYHAELERVDFRNSTEEVRKKINSWVESQTNGKIKDLFASGSIDPRAVLILVNAIYFKGKWKVEFNKKDTHEEPFWTSKNKSKQVQMMFLKDKFNLAKINNPSMEILELPYHRDELSMFILLPTNKEAQDQLERELTSIKLKEWTSSANMKKEKMNVFIPKFKLEEKYLLKSVLQTMGMTDVFVEGKADLSGMSRNHERNLIVSKVIHKAYIDINEEGTEAAASTGVEVVPVSVELLPEFRANHPFIFFIKHNETGSILFSGRYSSP
ncbi:serpin B3-like [Sceloporus undulatus]|uniref:serpin B3-like n=1 Tax=Sceloporus undulatus TaxID=8520 RepID=UPI001C4BC2D4|nr:serpin B3-like [Sceloporus undulatus]